MRKSINLTNISGVSPLIKDYLQGNNSVSSLYDKNLSFENLILQGKEKVEKYKHRKVLVTELLNQYKKIDLTEIQKNNLHKLSLENTVTITTGHQLNLMTGPLYFIYKILQVIKLCESMNRQQSELFFVPIFWMATEDHDFKEINHFYFKNKKIEWNGDYNDFVGEISINNSNFKNTLTEFYNELKYFPKGKELREIIEKSYFIEENLVDATRVLVHELFKNYGLLSIDGNNKSLKSLFSSFVKDDIVEKKSYQLVTETIQDIKSDYKIQVNPRKINFFYHLNQQRNRIDETNGKYYILGTCKNFTQEEILKELENFPERFSPNALLRPVYQELILPNVAYVGGNAEVAYWLELKNYFDHQDLPYPILIPRNSFLLITENQKEKLDKYQLDSEKLFLPKEKIIKNLVCQNSKEKFDFNKYEERLATIFNDLLLESSKTDDSWKNMILAQQKKQLNGLNKINKRFYKAERRKYHDLIKNFEQLYSELFPAENWQERRVNFSEYFAVYGDDFIKLLYNEISEYESVINLSTL
ncbi:bacillithiol biosynthesis cysteine-adding enzyme BshC [Apibacter sp. HY039]|uniref:bacillithiol biosynthesis cysteine-adding enzyme BshC n=1 Tax=Apibacter sp. HY039 TaxID=2501476 RepID=UPI0013E32544|nr:bacillithiol biosynthesis cysteine-adding enzyme BshC [Apibacter sp. HY039]